MQDNHVKSSKLSLSGAADPLINAVVLDAIAKLNDLNSSSQTLTELGRQIVKNTRSSLRAACTALWFKDDFQKMISLQAYSLPDSVEIPHKHYFYNLSKPSHITDCFRKGKSALHKKNLIAENDPRFEILSKSLTGVVLPLSTPEGIFGVFEILSVSDDTVDKNGLESLEILSAQIALLISNRKLADQLMHQSTLQTRLYEISDKLAQALDYESILRITVEELCHTLNLPGGAMHINLAAPVQSPSSNLEQIS